jgi:branched-chain amino acid transport system ATP-binding protein
MIGPNGAGKSSILRSISGLLRPSGGEARLEGRALTGMAPEQIARLGLALVPEGRHVFKTLTVAENLRLGAGSDSEDASRSSVSAPGSAPIASRAVSSSSSRSPARSSLGQCS